MYISLFDNFLSVHFFLFIVIIISSDVCQKSSPKRKSNLIPITIEMQAEGRCCFAVIWNLISQSKHNE